MPKSAKGHAIVHVLAQGPAGRLDALREAARQLGFSLSQPESDPLGTEWPSDETPGQALRRIRSAAGLSQGELSRRSGIPQPHISEMERHKRPIGKQSARRLALALEIDYRILL